MRSRLAKETEVLSRTWEVGELCTITLVLACLGEIGFVLKLSRRWARILRKRFLTWCSTGNE